MLILNCTGWAAPLAVSARRPLLRRALFCQAVVYGTSRNAQWAVAIRDAGSAAVICFVNIGIAIVFSIVAPLTSALYIGMREGQKETNERIKSLEETIWNAIPVLANAPKLEKTINQAHDDVIVLQETIKHLDTLPAQMKSIQIQLNNIQKQIHTIPGVNP